MKSHLLFVLALTIAPLLSTAAPLTSANGFVGEPPSNPREIMFIHGMYMTPTAWNAWLEKFRAEGYSVSAPAWPLHDGPVTELRSPARRAALARLTLDDVLESYRRILRAKSPKPILIGHSMGGLVAQILLSEGLATAAVAIDSAPPRGVFVLSYAFVRSNWGAVNLSAPADEPIDLSRDQFAYAFVNAQSPEAGREIYETYYVPESRRVGRGPLTKAAQIDFARARGPLLLVTGELDHTIPSRLTKANFKAYRQTPALTEMREFPGRDHTLIVSPGWEEIADFANSWIATRLKN